MEKLDVISDKNKKQLNDFIIWLTDNNDYSSHTVYMVFRECELDFLNLGNSAIDWEQRRYELAKDIIKVVIANENGINSEAVAKYSLNCADALIKRLKEENHG